MAWRRSTRKSVLALRRVWGEQTRRFAMPTCANCAAFLITVHTPWNHIPAPSQYQRYAARPHPHSSTTLYHASPHHTTPHHGDICDHGPQHRPLTLTALHMARGIGPGTFETSHCAVLLEALTRMSLRTYLRPGWQCAHISETRHLAHISVSPCFKHFAQTRGFPRNV